MEQKRFHFLSTSCQHCINWNLTLFSGESTLPVYVWQQHVCAAARRGCDHVWDGEGDCCGEMLKEKKFYCIDPYDSGIQYFCDQSIQVGVKYFVSDLRKRTTNA